MRALLNFRFVSLVVSLPLTLVSCHTIDIFDSSASDIQSYEKIKSARPEPRPTYRIATRPPQLPAPRLEKTPEVEKELYYFLKGSKSFIRASLKRREKYDQVVRAIFRDEGIPEELINVAMIESGFRREAKSPAGAVGLWQFTRSTGEVYGLEAGFLGDDRKDPILSTIAAARHLRDLYLAYRDWNLVLAAYNAGSGAVDRARSRAGSDDFWVIARKKKLPLQTRRYVPKFIAAALIVGNPGHYGISGIASDSSRPKDKSVG